MDVFNSSTSRSFKSTFAFVGYKHESEINRAIFRADVPSENKSLFLITIKPLFTFRNPDPLVVKRDIESRHAHVVGFVKALKPPSGSKYRPPHVLSPEVDNGNIGGPSKVNNEVFSMYPWIPKEDMD
ncbi:hypothetical protein COLO4_36780 [Corchorus olitorius]|uniref:Uncharacterized protein n=1 Tax=Corchorus olitorius TaxID=93759 RepID=A0A1R3G5F0_9ROSI|nr:hypothetical protein COLO4_36780 [Corchorus olitorius]